MKDNNYLGEETEVFHLKLKMSNLFFFSWRDWETNVAPLVSICSAPGYLPQHFPRHLCKRVSPVTPRLKEPAKWKFFIYLKIRNSHVKKLDASLCHKVAINCFGKIELALRERFLKDLSPVGVFIMSSPLPPGLPQNSCAHTKPNAIQPQRYLTP